MTARSRVAFYAPMKPPDHPNPSGDREIARLTLTALTEAGFAVTVASRLRTLDVAGDAEAQAAIVAAVMTEHERIAAEFAAAPPALWFTYHCYYKAPDLLGPALAKRWGIPYALSEPSISAKRRTGAWQDFAERAEAAIAAADALFWTTDRDKHGLTAAGHAARMTPLPAFVAAGNAPTPRGAHQPLRLLTVAMMRPGDKVTSYQRLARAVEHLRLNWTLDVIGDGAARAEVESAFSDHASRINWYGAIEDPFHIRRAMEDADLFAWPGVNEGVGLVWLEAQAAGLPVVAEDGPAARAVIGTPTLARQDDPAAFADIVHRAATDRRELGSMARAHIERNHTIGAAAATLRETLTRLLG